MRMQGGVAGSTAVLALRHRLWRMLRRTSVLAFWTVGAFLVLRARPPAPGCTLKVNAGQAKGARSSTRPPVESIRVNVLAAE